MVYYLSFTMLWVLLSVAWWTPFVLKKTHIYYYYHWFCLEPLTRLYSRVCCSVFRQIPAPLSLKHRPALVHIWHCSCSELFVCRDTVAALQLQSFFPHPGCFCAEFLWNEKECSFTLWVPMTPVGCIIIGQVWPVVYDGWCKFWGFLLTNSSLHVFLRQVFA